jgi:hypothetical protein
MSQFTDLIALLALAAVVGLWLKATRMREHAVEEVRRQCAEHGLQLLDETVGLRSLRLRRAGGRRRLELGYAFEVSAHGDDRLDGRMWMHDGRLAGLSLPNVVEPLPSVAEPPPARPRLTLAAPPAQPGAEEAQPVVRHDNVIPLRPRRPRAEP